MGGVCLGVVGMYIYYKLSSSHQTAASKYMTDVAKKAGEKLADGSSIVVDDLVVEASSGVVNPIAISLTQDPIELLSLTESNTTFDYGSGLVKTSWIKPSSALLAYDTNKNGKVDHYSEIVITSWASNAKTDFEALLIAFDSNKDKVFNSQDEKFDQFLLWRDLNMNGVSEENELQTLSEAGLVGIDFNSQTAASEQMHYEGIFNTANVHWLDGEVTMAYDLAFFCEVG